MTEQIILPPSPPSFPPQEETTLNYELILLVFIPIGAMIGFILICIIRKPDRNAMANVNVRNDVSVEVGLKRPITKANAPKISNNIKVNMRPSRVSLSSLLR